MDASDPTKHPRAEQALDENDAGTLAGLLSVEELDKRKAAEELLRLVRDRKRNTSSYALVSQVMVSVVAAVGMLVNAYQSYTNKQQHDRQTELDDKRWSREFERAQRADKYRAFFETSVLATDPSNPDKRLVGYALLQEFVADEDYNTKATLMLEESLAQELRGSASAESTHRNAVVAIVSALSQTSDCKALGRAALSVDRVAQHHKNAQDLEETHEIFRLYVRRLLGRAALVCKDPDDFFSVRRPLAQALARLPELVDEEAKLKDAEVSDALVTMLAEECRDELEIGRFDCAQVFQRYLTLCGQPLRAAEKATEAAACQTVQSVAAEFSKVVAASGGPGPHGG